MIVRTYSNVVVIYQAGPDDDTFPEPAIIVQHEASPLIVVSQEGREIVLNIESVDEFVKALREMKAKAVQWEAEAKAVQWEAERKAKAEKEKR